MKHPAPNGTQKCKQCNNEFTGSFCNVCGEKVYTDHDRSIPHFFEDAIHFVTHFEGTIFTTLKAILFKPGKLSLDYCNGIRKKYFKPLPFFMLLVVLYLIFPVFTGLNMPFKMYFAEGKPYAVNSIKKKTGVPVDSLLNDLEIRMQNKPFDNREVAKKYYLRNTDSLLHSNLKLENLALAYDKKSEKISKLLLLVLLPLTALPLYLSSFYKRKFFFDHLVIATEINSFFLLFSFFLVPGLFFLMYKIFPAHALSFITDMGVAITSYAIIAIFAAFSFRRFYHDTWWLAVVKALLLVTIHFYMVVSVYKPILLWVTMSFI